MLVQLIAPFALCHVWHLFANHISPFKLSNAKDALSSAKQTFSCSKNSSYCSLHYYGIVVLFTMEYYNTLSAGSFNFLHFGSLSNIMKDSFWVLFGA